MAVVPQGLVSGIAISVLCGGALGWLVALAEEVRPVQSPEMPHVAPQIPQLALRRLVLRRQCDQLALPLDDGRLYSHAGDAKRERDPIALANLGSVIVLHRYPPSLASGPCGPARRHR